MSINFDSLPDKMEGGNNFQLLPEGWHEFTIAAAKMKTSPKTGRKYLALRLKNPKGCVFDNLMESDKPALQFKLKQFITACHLPIHGEFELSDLTKVVIGKTIMASIKVAHNEGYADRNEVALFDNGGYKPVEIDQNAPLPWEEDSPFSSESAGGDESY